MYFSSSSFSSSHSEFNFNWFGLIFVCSDVNLFNAEHLDDKYLKVNDNEKRNSDLFKF